MSWFTLVWSMVAGACVVLGLMHLSLWLMDRKRWEFLLFSICASAAAGVALAEHHGLATESLDAYRLVDRWIPVFLAAMLISLVWFVHLHLGTGRRWLAGAISMLWLLGLGCNFLSSQSMTFREITALKRLPTWFGVDFTAPVAVPNPAQHVGNAASVLILVFLTDATVRLWRRGNRRRAGIAGGGSILFITLAGVHTPLVDSGVIRTPYMVSFAFLAIIVSVSYELLRAVYMSSRLSRQVLASEARWQALLNNVSLAVVSLDPQSRITLVNPFFERTLGYRAAELVGRPITDLLPSADADEFRERFRFAAERGPRPLARWAFRGASGHFRTFEWSTVRLLDGEGEFAGLLTVGADITDRLQAQTDLARVRHDLEHLSRTNLLGELLAALAHELNQPLTSILSNAQAGRRFLARPSPDLEEIKTILDEIARDDKRAGEVIHRLRALLRKETPTRATFALGDAVHEVEQLVRGGLVDGGIRLRVQLGAPTIRVEAVRVELQQVLMNLILNAAQALKDHSLTQREILVTTELDGSEARISVLDNGPGIAPKKLPTLFEPFVTSRADGMGMGLSICRRLIENNQGRIEAANRPEGGAAFTFTLPTT
jgi:PAS domain S-box-containing protein